MTFIKGIPSEETLFRGNKNKSTKIEENKQASMRKRGKRKDLTIYRLIDTFIRTQGNTIKT